MKYSFVFVLCLGVLVLQCSGRPQADLSSTAAPSEPEATPASEQMNTDTESATETAAAVAAPAETVVFDEAEVPTSGISPQDEQTEEEQNSDATGVTTDLPVAAMKEGEQDQTTIQPLAAVPDDGSSDVPTAGEGQQDDADPAPSADMESDAPTTMEPTTTASEDSS